jgi:hypothetical protein
LLLMLLLRPDGPHFSLCIARSLLRPHRIPLRLVYPPLIRQHLPRPSTLLGILTLSLLVPSALLTLLGLLTLSLLVPSALHTLLGLLALSLFVPSALLGLLALSLFVPSALHTLLGRAQMIISQPI